MVESLARTTRSGGNDGARNRQPALRMNTDLDPLVRLAVELRDLPRHDFRARLREDLERIANMTTSKAASTQPIRGLRSQPVKGFLTRHALSRS